MVNRQTITTDEMSYLLGMVTTMTRRKFDSDEGSLWFNLLRDYTYDECHEAFKHFLTDGHNEYLTAGLIIGYIKKLRQKRWEARKDALIAPNGLDGEGYLAWLHEKQEAIMSPPRATPPSHQLGQGNSESTPQIER